MIGWLKKLHKFLIGCLPLTHAERMMLILPLMQSNLNNPQRKWFSLTEGVEMNKNMLFIVIVRRNSDIINIEVIANTKTEALKEAYRLLEITSQQQFDAGFGSRIQNVIHPVSYLNQCPLKTEEKITTFEDGE